MHMFCMTFRKFQIWWFGSAFIMIHHFLIIFSSFFWQRSRWLGDGCKLRALQRLRSSMVSGARPSQKKPKDSWDSCTLWCSYKWKRFKSFTHWNAFQYLWLFWLWHINMAEQRSVTIAGGTLWLQLQTLCCTTSPCNWDIWYFVFFACILRLHEYNMF